MTGQAEMNDPDGAQSIALARSAGLADFGDPTPAEARKSPSRLADDPAFADDGADLIGLARSVKLAGFTSENHDDNRSRPSVSVIPGSAIDAGENTADQLLAIARNVGLAGFDFSDEPEPDDVSSSAIAPVSTLARADEPRARLTPRYTSPSPRPVTPAAIAAAPKLTAAPVQYFTVHIVGRAGRELLRVWEQKFGSIGEGSPTQQSWLERDDGGFQTRAYLMPDEQSGRDALAQCHGYYMAGRLVSFTVRNLQAGVFKLRGPGVSGPGGAQNPSFANPSLPSHMREAGRPGEFNMNLNLSATNAS